MLQLNTVEFVIFERQIQRYGPIREDITHCDALFSFADFYRKNVWLF